MSQLREAMLRVEEQEAEEATSFAPTAYDKEEPLLLSFRHGHKGSGVIIEFPVPDLVIGEILMSYLKPSRLIQRTPHSDIRRVIRETP